MYLEILDLVDDLLSFSKFSLDYGYILHDSKSRYLQRQKFSVLDFEGGTKLHKDCHAVE